MRIIAAVAVLFVLCLSSLAHGQSRMQAFSDGQRDWDYSNLLVAWENDPGRVASIDENVLGLLEASAAFWAGSDWASQRKPSTADRLKGAEALLERAPESVVLRLLRAEIRSFDDIDRYYPELLAAHNSAKDFRYLPIRRMYVAAQVHSHATAIGDAVVANDASDNANKTLRGVLVDPPKDHMDQRYLLAQLKGVYKWAREDFDLSLPASEAASAARDPWVALMVEGLAHDRVAWSVRGRGGAHTVTRQMQAKFSQRMKKASKPLTRAYDMRSESPEAAAAMIDVTKAIADSPDEIAMWFRRMITAQTDWMPGVHEYIWAIRPRWRGSIGHMTRLAAWIAVESLNSKDLQDYFFRAIEMIGEDAGSHRYIWLDDDLAEAARALLHMQIRLDDKPDVARQRLLGIAWARRDWAEAASIAAEIDNPSSWSPLQHFRVHYERVLDDVVLGNATESRVIQTALDEEFKGNFERAAELFGVANESKGFGPYVAQAVRRRAVSSNWILDFSEGRRASLIAEPGLPGWRLWKGDAAEDDGAILLGGEGGSAWLAPGLNPGPRYEMTLTCRMPPGAGKAWSRVLIGHNWRTEHEQWHTVSLRWHDAKARMRFRFESVYSAAVSKPLEDGVVDLRIVCYDGSLLVQADGELLYRGPLTMGLDYTPGTGIALSTWVDGKGRPSAFEQITIRELDERPEELDGKLVKIFDER